MIKNYIECGQIVGTHGVSGEVRVNPWCDEPSFLTGFKQLYLDENGNNIINVKKARTANNVVLVKFENIDSIESAEKMRGKVVYIKRDDANLEGRHFIQEIIGCEVFDTENTILGKITDIINLPANDVWQIENNGNNYLFPAIDQFIVSIDVEKERIVINPLEGIFDHEN